MLPVVTTYNTPISARVMAQQWHQALGPFWRRCRRGAVAAQIVWRSLTDFFAVAAQSRESGCEHGVTSGKFTSLSLRSLLLMSTTCSTRAWHTTCTDTCTMTSLCCIASLWLAVSLQVNQRTHFQLVNLYCQPGEDSFARVEGLIPHVIQRLERDWCRVWQLSRRFRLHLWPQRSGTSVLSHQGRGTPVSPGKHAGELVVVETQCTQLWRPGPSKRPLLP